MGYLTDEELGEARRPSRSGHTCYRTNSEHWELYSAAHCPQCRKGAHKAGRTEREIADEMARVENLLRLAPVRSSKESAIAALKTLSDEERLEALHVFCVHCGCIQPEHGRRCQCWNDE